VKMGSFEYRTLLETRRKKLCTVPDSPPGSALALRGCVMLRPESTNNDHCNRPPSHLS
jgi:hypothetical protein